MTTEEVVEKLRLKERSRRCLSWQMCKEAADCIDELTREQREEEERSRFLRCPHCGGRLSEDRGGYRHCYACHMEFDTEVNR